MATLWENGYKFYHYVTFKLAYAGNGSEDRYTDTGNGCGDRAVNCTHIC